MIKLSIIIPMYNAECWISNMINDIYNQTYLPKFEIVIVDDGSTDDSKKLVFELMKEKKEIIYIWQKNQKQAVARNKGLSVAKGEKILFLDSDDRMAKTMFEKLFATNKSLIITGISKINEAGKVLQIETCSNLKKANNQKNLIATYLTKNKEMDVGLWNKLFEKKIIDCHNLTFELDNYFEDSLFVLSYLLHIEVTDIYFIEEPLYFLVKRSGSTTHTHEINLKEICDRYFELIESKLERLGVLEEKELTEILFSLKIRLVIFYLNRSIVNCDVHNAHLGIREQIRAIKIRQVFFSSIPIKYKLGFLLMKGFPKRYAVIYKKKKGV